MKNKFIAILLPLVFLCNASNAADLYVNNGAADAGDCTTSLPGCGTIGYAVAQATNSDTIHIGPGTFELSTVVTIDKKLTFIGSGRTETIITNDSALAELFKIEIMLGTPTVTIEDLSFENSRFGEFGRCLSTFGTDVPLALAPDLIVSRVGFTGCAEEDGGAINFRYAGDLTVTDSHFNANTANNASGGAILAESSGTITVTNSQFLDNVSRESGAAINLNSVASFQFKKLTISGSIDTTASGGAVAIYNSEGIIG